MIEFHPTSATRRKDPDLPNVITARLLRYQWPGFRASWLLTSLHDPQAYPYAELVDLYHRRWQIEDAAVEERKAAFESADKQVTEKTRAAAAASPRREKSGEALQPLRDGEAVAAAQLQRLTLASEALDAELQRNSDAVLLCENRLQQIAADHTRESTLENDAQIALDGLTVAIAELDKLTDDEGEALGAEGEV